jgi:hypothetical protein
MAHFEDIWNEAEKISGEFGNDLEEIRELIRKSVQKMLDYQLLGRYTEVEKEMGNVLFELAAFCNALNSTHQVNTFTALLRAIEDRKEKLYNPEE